MYEAYLRNLLAPLGIYDLTEHSVSGAAVCALGAGLDAVDNRLAVIERESLTATAEDEGLTRREALRAASAARLRPAARCFMRAESFGRAAARSCRRQTPFASFGRAKDVPAPA